MAMTDVIARLAVSLGMDTTAFVTGSNKTQKESTALQRNLNKLGKTMAGVGAKLSIGLTAPLTAFGVASVQAAMESRDAMAQVERALDGMGDAAGRTAAQLEAAASGIMQQSLYDDDDVLRKVTANMLTFGKVSGEAFDRAQQAAVDLSAHFNTDLQGSAIMVGKALNDPLKGLAALGRAGVSFTAEQKAMIGAMVEAGNIAGAQGLILDELAKQYGGAAKAARDADPMAAAAQSWATFQENVGNKLLPLLPPLLTGLTAAVDAFGSLSPGMQQAAVVAGVLAAGLGPVLVGLGGIATVLATVGPPLVAFSAGLLGVGTASGVAATGARALGIAVAGAIGPVTLIATAAYGAYLAWKNWDTIGPMLFDTYVAVKTWIGDKLTAVLNAVLVPIRAVERGFAWLYDRVVGNSWVPDMVDGVAASMGRLHAALVAPAEAATGATEQAFRTMAENTQGLLDRLFPEVRRLLNYRADLATLAASGLPEDQQAEARRRLAREVNGEGFDNPVSGGWGGPIVPDLERVGAALEGLTQRAQVNTVRIAKSFKDMADQTLSALSRMTQSIQSGGFLGILESVIGLGLQLGSIGAFGKTIAGRVNAVPAYAGGTNFHPGGLALVGERGPELVAMPRGSRVTPNHQLAGQAGGASVMEIRPSPLFEVYVDGKLVQAAPGLIQGGAQVAQSQMAFRQSRRIG